MPDFTTSVIFFIFIFVIMGLLLLTRFAKYGSAFGSFKSTMLGGIPVIDKGGNGEVAELMQWHQHPITKKIRLRINIPDKFTEFNTPYIFDAIDFYPIYKAGYWEHYSGAITLYKDFEGREDYRNNQILNLAEQNLRLRTVVNIYKRNIPAMLEYLEGQKLKDVKKDETLDIVKMLKTMRTITDEVNVDTTATTPESEMFE